VATLVQNDKSHCTDTLQSWEGQWEEMGLQTCSEDWWTGRQGDVLTVPVTRN